MIPNRSVSWYVVAATVVGVAFVGAGCGSDSGGTTDAGAGAAGRGGGGGAAGQAGSAGVGGVGRGGTGGNAGASAGSGGLGGRGGSGGSGAGGRGGFTVPDGGFNPDGFSFDAFSFDGGGIDTGAVPACAASVSNGGPCTSGTDTVCRPAGGTLCICLLGNWSCG